MTIHNRETPISRKFTEEEAAHIERGAVFLLQAKSNKLFSNIMGNTVNFFQSLQVDDPNSRGWIARNYSLPCTDFTGVDDSISSMFVRFATEQECERFNMPYIPMPTKPTHLKIVKD